MFTKNELRLFAIINWVIMLIASFIAINTKAEVGELKTQIKVEKNYIDTYFKQATDGCKQEYVDYNINLYGGRR